MLKTSDAQIGDRDGVSQETAKLRVEKLSVTFDREGERMGVLHEVDFDIAPGEFVCVLGPSGCGKSTLLHIMAGFLSPDQGSVFIDGEVVQGPDPRRIFVFQEHSVFPWLTVKGNVEFGLQKLPRLERQQRAARYIELVGLQGFEHSYPMELSGGMKQRLEVARALAVDPDMLFLDEPFSGLDSITRLSMRKELLRLWEAERTTIILVTHDIDEAVQLADRIILLTARPAAVQQIVPIRMAHPRSLLSPEYLKVRAQVAGMLGVLEQV